MAYAIKVDGKVKLEDIDPAKHSGLTEEEAREKTAKLGEKLDDLQELLYAAGMHSMLIVLQGRDTAGKDGTIRKLSHYLNVQACHVKGFKVPTPEEISHDFLWRVHSHVPGKGLISIFNRSHYEDVLAVRVHDIVPEEVWKKRYGQINEFEQLLSESGTLIVKICLHISKKEQEKRLLAREADATKSWKLSVGDWKEREYWDDYTKAYNEALTKCNDDCAPWYVVPADHKWFRDLAITELLVDTLEPHRKKWMKVLTERGKIATSALAEFRKSKAK